MPLREALGRPWGWKDEVCSPQCTLELGVSKRSSWKLPPESEESQDAVPAPGILRLELPDRRYPSLFQRLSLAIKLPINLPVLLDV